MKCFGLQVDEEELKVRPSHKRCIVILREIDESTPVEEVRAIFSDETLPKILSCEFAHNNVWYLTFESDDDAQRAYHYVRDHVKEFKVTGYFSLTLSSCEGFLWLSVVLTGTKGENKNQH